MQSVKGQTTSLKEFADTIRQVYSNMTFGGVDISVTGVELVNIPYGLSFAQYSRINNSRQILFNYRHFLNRHWSDEEDTKRRDSLRQVCYDMVYGVLAHEWAHHYLGHTFENNSVLKERNADILAGRILFEHYHSEKKGIDTTNLKRSIRLLDALEDANASLYHLSKNDRKELIIKGYTTSWLIENSKELTEDTQLYKLDNELKGEKLDSLSVKQDRIIRLSAQDNKSKFRKIALQIAAKYLSPRLFNSPEIASYINIIDSVIKSKISIFVTVDNNNFTQELIQFKEYYNNLAANDTTNILRYIEEERKKISDKIRNDINRRSLESLYNLLYFKKPFGKSTFESTPFVKKNLSDFVKSDFELLSVNVYPFWYVLSYGGIKFEIDYRGANSLNNKQPNKLVTIYQKNTKRSISLKKSDSQKENGFLYYFTADDDNYFIDRYYHLWTETIGAKAINNKIFLQRYTINP